MKEEQERIEQELIDFENHVFINQVGNQEPNRKNSINQSQRTGVIFKSNNTVPQQTMRNRRY